MKKQTKLFVTIPIFLALIGAVAVHAYSSRMPSVPPVELKELFQLADGNKDGTISIAEFENYLRYMKTKPIRYANDVKICEETGLPCCENESGMTEGGCCKEKTTGDQNAKSCCKEKATAATLSHSANENKKVESSDNQSL
jgi:hypothetical protein